MLVCFNYRFDEHEALPDRLVQYDRVLNAVPGMIFVVLPSR